MRRHLWPFYRARLRHVTRPILIGPFRGEVGFEALYWLPWLKKQLEGVTAPCYVVTRGGAQPWYGFDKGCDLYHLRTPQDVRVENALQSAKTGMMKQRRITAFDKAVIADAKRALAIPRAHVLHPAWMYAALRPFWDGCMGLRDFGNQVAFDRLTPPPLPEGITLPKEFAAVRFYFRHTFQPYPAVTDFCKATIEQLSRQTPVLLLDAGTHVDEHLDYHFKGTNIATLKELVPGITPENNLAVLSAILGRATAFIGTYGGLAQLALRMGIPSVSFYADWGGTAIAHKHLSDYISLQTGVPFIVQRITETPLIRHVLPEIAFAAPRSSSKGAAAPYGSNQVLTQTA